MDINKLIIEFADISADAALGKDLTKHHATIIKNLTLIAQHLNESAEHPDAYPNHNLMEIGYWLFVYRDKIVRLP